MTGQVSGSVMLLAPDNAIRVVYFSEAPRDSDALRLVAAVVWRRTPEPGTRSAGTARGRGARPWLRKLWSHTGLSATFHGRRREGGVDFGPGGAQATAYDSGRHVVRVHDREYALPTGGQPVVLLVDEDVSARNEPRIAVRTVRLPLGLDPDAGGRDVAAPAADASWVRGPTAAQHTAWTAALRADPAVCAFLDGQADS